MKTKTLIPLLVMGLIVAAFATGATAACKNKVTTMTYTSGGYPIWSGSLTYKQSITWCYDGKKVTSISYSNYGRVSGPISWIYDGVLAYSKSNGVGNSWYQITTIGDFYNNKKTTTCGDLHPVINQRVSGTGGIAITASSKSGCPVHWTLTTV